MLLVTLVIAALALTATAALVYAVRTAADGREDDTGFHFTGQPRPARRNLVAASARERNHPAAPAIHSRPAA